MRLYGWTPEEAVGAYIHEFLSTTFPRPWKRLSGSFCVRGSGGENWCIKLVRDGSLRWQAGGRCCVIPRGLERKSRVNTDITEQKRTQGVADCA